jgi:hypothetical protein
MGANPTYLGGFTNSSADEPRSIDELDTAIRTIANEMNVATYRLLMLVREFDERCGWQKWGLRSCAEWLAWRCDLSMSAAREKVRTAHALREMPAISAAFESGRLSYSKVRALSRVVEYHDEDSLLDYALRVTAAQVEERCREIRNAAPESVGKAWRAWEHRSLVVSRDPVRGMLKITVEVPIEDGEVIAKAIERVADAGDAALGLEFAARKAAGIRDSDDSSEVSANGWCAQQADALLAIAKASLAGTIAAGAAAADALGAGTVAAGGRGDLPNAESAPRSVADHYQVVVHVDESALRGGNGRSDLPIETVKRLTCDCSVITIVEDDRGNPLDVGRKQRTVSTPMKRALWARDRGCIFPGCGNTRYVDTHHIRHWANGGETSLENLRLLCSHHHRLVHEGGFGMRLDGDDKHYFVRPDGRVIPRCGYRREDMLDDFVEDDAVSPSAEGRFANGSAGPSAEERSANGSANPSAEGRLANRSANPSAEGHFASDAEDPSAERWPSYAAWDPATEVRETAGVYRIGWRSAAA